MVAASKLRRAQEQAEKAHPYSFSMAKALARLTHNVVIDEDSSVFLRGTGEDRRYMVIVVTSDRGLCGGFNASLLKAARRKIHKLQDDGKDVQIVCLGRKGYEALQAEFKPLIAKTFFNITSQKRMSYSDAQAIRDYIVSEFHAGSFDVCSMIYSDFISVMLQEPKSVQLVPFDMDEFHGSDAANALQGGEAGADEGDDHLASPYEFEPDEHSIIDTLLPRNIGVQLFRAMLDSAAGEQASRMTAMDNATRSAGDMIQDLTLSYNRARQAYITKELIEIISGAESV